MEEVIYALDANVFIEAFRRYYAFDLAPGFWSSLVNYSEKNRIVSIDRVKQELLRGQDDLAVWASSDFHKAFVSTNDMAVLSSYRDIINWVNTQDQFSDAAKSDFANGADGWLIAYAKANGCVVVTHEVLSPEVKRKVPIPNVCQAFKIRFIDTFEMLRNLKIRFM